MEIFWSATRVTFILGEWRDDYIAAGSWPDDAVEVEHSVYETFGGDAPLGKVLGVGEDGMPTWIDAPALPDNVIIANNTAHKSGLMKEANNQISILTDATDPDLVDLVDPNDVELLQQWKLYRIALNKVTDMLHPVWPVVPNA